MCSSMMDNIWVSDSDRVFQLRQLTNIQTPEKCLTSILHFAALILLAQFLPPGLNITELKEPARLPPSVSWCRKNQSQKEAQVNSAERSALLFWPRVTVDYESEAKPFSIFQHSAALTLRGGLRSDLVFTHCHQFSLRSDEGFLLSVWSSRCHGNGDVHNGPHREGILPFAVSIVN